MKKFWMLLLTALMVLSLCACQKKAEEPAPETPAPSETAEQSEETGFRTAQVVQTGSGVTVKTAQDWAAEYPEIYASYLANEENTEVHDYTKDYPMIPIIMRAWRSPSSTAAPGAMSTPWRM